MIERKRGGQILNILSASARKTMPGYAAYGASKAALSTHTGAGPGMGGVPDQCQCHCPGYILTEMTREFTGTDAGSQGA